MPVSHSNLPHKINQDNSGISKPLAPNVSMANFSLEDNYHGGASVGVPFTWESQPGTPKVKFRESPLPPLTPPPSYFYNTPKRSTKKHSKPSNIFNTIFPKRANRKSSYQVSPASFSSSTSSSSSYSSSPWSMSYSVPSSPATVSKSYQRISSTIKSFDARIVENECESPVSPLCFGVGRRGSERSRGFYSSIIKTLLLRDVQ